MYALEGLAERSDELADVLFLFCTQSLWRVSLCERVMREHTGHVKSSESDVSLWKTLSDLVAHFAPIFGVDVGQRKASPLCSKLKRNSTTDTRGRACNNDSTTLQTHRVEQTVLERRLRE